MYYHDHIYRVLAVLCFHLWCLNASVHHCAQLQEAVRYRKGINGTKIDYERAFLACTKAAEMGSAAANTCLGEMYKHGQGRLMDLDTALRLFNASAAVGDPAAQRNMAICFATGLCGVPEDQSRAVLYYHFAAMGGDLEAQMAMGYRHQQGVNVPKNCNAAVEFYTAPAEVCSIT